VSISWVSNRPGSGTTKAANGIPGNGRSESGGNPAAFPNPQGMAMSGFALLSVQPVGSVSRE
jgi:hypothetical protein